MMTKRRMKTPEARQQGHTREQGRVQEAWLPEEPSGIIVNKTNMAKQKQKHLLSLYS